MIRSVFREPFPKEKERTRRHPLVVVLHRDPPPFFFFFFPFQRHTTSLRTTFALPRRVNKSCKKSWGGVVRGIWSVFDAERARLAVVRGRREEGRKIREKPRNDSQARREISFSFFHETYIRLPYMPPGLCVFCLLLHHRIPERPRFYMFSLSLRVLKTLSMRQSWSNFLTRHAIVEAFPLSLSPSLNARRLP